MKIEEITIKDFKLFENIPAISFKNKTLEEVSNRFLVLGDNGTGKTSLLQAIALPLAIATHQIPTPAEFDWIGFVPGRYARWGLPRIEMTLSFTDTENQTTREVAGRWYERQTADFKQKNKFVKPGISPIVHLTLDGEDCLAGTHAQFLQFRGRHYAMGLLSTDPAARSYFPKLPGLFWFDQFRNLGSSPQPENGERASENRAHISFETGIARYRRYLSKWKYQQLVGSHPFSNNYLELLENLYKQVFPGRTFAKTTEPMPGIDSPAPEDYYFLLDDGHRTYDIAEMSAGEQAVFPILYEFVRQQIAYSVVLIDEIDLNLHPPAAQELVSQLTKIGPTCQFIFTTHSESVSDLIGEDETYRLPGGSLCL
jgi:hypothetical protein